MDFFEAEHMPVPDTISLDPGSLKFVDRVTSLGVMPGKMSLMPRPSVANVQKQPKPRMPCGWLPMRYDL